MYSVNYINAFNINGHAKRTTTLDHFRHFKLRSKNLINGMRNFNRKYAYLGLTRQAYLEID
jgi:hypothetical protein